MKVAGLVLAGGRGSRLGGSVPKPLVALGGRRLLDHVLSVFPKDLKPILLSSNHPALFAGFGLDIVADRVPGFAGPLAGLDAAAAWLSDCHSDITHILALPGDTPFLPPGLARRMTATSTSCPCVARHCGRLHPTVALWPLSSLAGLSDFLASGENASIRRFLDITGFKAVEIDGVGAESRTGKDGSGRSVDPFFNINTQDDLEAARLIVESS